MLLSEIADRICDDAPQATHMLDRVATEACIKKAVRYYCGFAKLTNPPLAPDLIHDPIDASPFLTENANPQLDQDFDINLSENDIIEPLYTLYIEKENAILLEASRGMGTDPYGRSVSEIEAQILQREEELPKAAFLELIVSV